MRPGNRIKRNLTEPQEALAEEQLNCFRPIVSRQLNVKDICFDFQEKTEERKRTGSNYYMLNDRRSKLNRPNKLARLQLPSSKLPTLANQIPSFEEQVSYKQEKNKKNVTLLNAIIEILKPGQEIQEVQKRSSKIDQKSYKFERNYNQSQSRQSTLIRESFNEVRCLPYSQENYKINNKFVEKDRIKLREDRIMSQFTEILSQNSTKNYRGPKIIENQMTRLAGQGNIARRRIASEEKSRPKYNIEKKQKSKKQTTGCFDGIQILTFSNKFPGLSHLRTQGRTEGKAQLDIGKYSFNEFMDAH